MTVKDLADKLDVRVKDVLAKLLMKRMMMTINSTLDIEVGQGPRARVRRRDRDAQLRGGAGLGRRRRDQARGHRYTRAPVVTVMGHVDHGKTSLLDAIRETKVAEREAGGITQHIGAYHVDVGGRSVVFLDTPGHEAFTLMRARGAKVTDIVVLVVAADDGVMPQTQGSGRPRARRPTCRSSSPSTRSTSRAPTPTTSSASWPRSACVPEDWGGTTVTVPVSAKKRQNLDQLLEMILLSADILELKANAEAQRVGHGARGQARSRPRSGGHGAGAGRHAERRRQLHRRLGGGQACARSSTIAGRPVKSAGPATPVEVLGSDQPALARRLVPGGGRRGQGAADCRVPPDAGQGARARRPRSGRLTLESLQEQIAEGGIKELPIIVKADVQGSAEVLADTLDQAVGRPA